MSVRDRLEQKFDALNEAAGKLEDALLVVAPVDKPRTRGRLTAVNNEANKVNARISTINATTPAPKPQVEAELLEAIADVGRAVGTSAGLNALLSAATRLINAYKV